MSSTSSSNSSHKSRAQTYQNLTDLKNTQGKTQVKYTQIRSKTESLFIKHHCCVVQLSNDEYFALELCGDSTYQAIKYRTKTDLLQEFSDEINQGKAVSMDLASVLKYAISYKKENPNYFFGLNDCQSFAKLVYNYNIS